MFNGYSTVKRVFIPRNITYLLLRINSPFKNRTLTTKIIKYVVSIQSLVATFQGIKDYFRISLGIQEPKYFKNFFQDETSKKFWTPRNFSRIPGR